MPGNKKAEDDDDDDVDDDNGAMVLDGAVVTNLNLRMNSGKSSAFPDRESRLPKQSVMVTSFCLDFFICEQSS